MLQLENYLKAVLQNSVYRQHHETVNSHRSIKKYTMFLFIYYFTAQLAFLEISRVSFINQLGHKGKEGLIKKRGGDTTLNKFNTWIDDWLACCCCCCLGYCQRFDIVFLKYNFSKNVF